MEAHTDTSMKTVEELAEQYRYHPEIPLTDEEMERLGEYLFEVDRRDY